MVLTWTIILIVRHIYVNNVPKHPNFNMYFNIIVSMSISSETFFPSRFLITQIFFTFPTGPRVRVGSTSSYEGVPGLQSRTGNLCPHFLNFYYIISNSLHTIYRNTLAILPLGKGREAGVYSALQLEEVDCTLIAWRSSLIHLQKRHHTKRRKNPLLAKEGTFIEGILLAIRNLLQLLESFTCRKVGTLGRLFNFPSERRRAEDFVHRKNPTASAGFKPANSGSTGQHANH
jgi:hypothetical protein